MPSWSGEVWRPVEPLRILLLAPRACWPADTGAKLRNYYLARGLSRCERVTLLAFSENQPNSGSGFERVALEHRCERVVEVERDRPYTLGKLIRGAAGRTPLAILNYTTRAMEKTLSKLLDQSEFDVVQVESLHLTGYLPILRGARSRPKLVCDWHNVESELMRRYSAQTPSLARRLYARRTARSLAAQEKRVLEEFDAHLVVSERDRDRLLEAAPGARVYVVENGVDVDYFAEVRERVALPRHRVLFVGSMDYYANEDAAVHFANEVWPGVIERFPGLSFTIVGRSPTSRVRSLARRRGVEVTGSVEDVRPYYREAAAAVVPLRMGAGSRLKILEAMAAGVPIVSTRLGAEGLDVRDGENILIADTAQGFGDRLAALLNENGLRAVLSTAGYSLVRERYDWALVSESHRNVLRSLVVPGTATAAVSMG